MKKTSEHNNPKMFDSSTSFANITIEVDPINRKRTDGSDNVMAMFYEEQPMMWEFVQNEIEKSIKQAKGEIDFLDVGTGSGVWSILVAKNLKAKNILAIDKSLRAIKWAKKNASLNEANFKVSHEFYNISTAPYQSCNVIGIYAPYHLYPKEVEFKIPQHARGGVDGQQIFREQLVVANYHLAKNGIIVFNQMCLGRNGHPEFVNYIPQLVENVSLEYTDIFPPMKTKDFLKAIYGNKYANYVNGISKRFPEIYYCNGIIRRDGKGSITEVTHSIYTKGRSWKDRIELHTEIAKHGM